MGIQPSQLGSATVWKRLKIPVPLDLALVDIGGGIKEGTSSPGSLSLDEVVCAPLRILLEALTAPGVWQSQPVDLDWKGLMSSFTSDVTSTSLSGNALNLNVAIISREYLNLSLRLGYHFNMIDGYLSDDRNSNYIYFRFFGGVTEIIRRTRRGKLLTQILEKNDFAVESKGDLVIARIKKIDRAQMEAKFRLIGRLIGYTRQLDVLLRKEMDIDFYSDQFLEREKERGG